MVTIVSEIGVYHFFRDRMKFVEHEARKFARFAVSMERKLNTGIKDFITNELQMNDFATKQDILMTKTDLQQSMDEVKHSISELKHSVSELKHSVTYSINALENKFDQKLLHFEAKMEKNTKDIVLLVVTLMTAIIGAAVAIMKLL